MHMQRALLEKAEANRRGFASYASGRIGLLDCRIGTGDRVSMLRDVPDRPGRWPHRREQPMVVEPPDPTQGGELHVFEAAPGPAAVNHLRLEQSDHGFRERVVVRVAAAADRGLNAGFQQALTVANREILYAAIAVLHWLLITLRLSLADRLLQHIERQITAQRTRCASRRSAAKTHRSRRRRTQTPWLIAPGAFGLISNSPLGHAAPPRAPHYELSFGRAAKGPTPGQTSPALTENESPTR